mgnify:CR=1 FL=1
MNAKRELLPHEVAGKDIKDPNNDILNADWLSWYTDIQIKMQKTIFCAVTRLTICRLIVTNVSTIWPTSLMKFILCDRKILDKVLSGLISFFVARNISQQTRLIS